jgi:hypothetical protein
LYFNTRHSGEVELVFINVRKKIERLNSTPS